MVHAVALLAIVLVAGPLAVHVPLAVLAGILIFVAWNMGEWHEFARLRRYGASYATKLVGTFGLTIVFDLTVAVEVGLVLACVFFIYRMGTLFRIEPVALPPDRPAVVAGEAADGMASASNAALPPASVHAVRLHGALFFGAVGSVEGVADELPPGTRALVLDFERLIFIDSSGFDALRQLLRTLEAAGVRVVVCSATGQPLQLLHRSGFAGLLGSDNLAPDLERALDRLCRNTASAPRADAAPVPAASSGLAEPGDSR